MQNFMKAISAIVFLQRTIFPSPWFCVEFADGGYHLGWLTKKPAPPELKERCGRGSPSFVFVASCEEKRTFSVHAPSRLGDACNKYSKDFAPTNPRSVSPQSWCLQQQGDTFSAETLDHNGNSLPSWIQVGVLGLLHRSRIFHQTSSCWTLFGTWQGRGMAAEADGSGSHPGRWCEAGKDH